MPFDISIMTSFSAAHQLRLYDGSLEPLHGHNWRVRVTVSSDELDATGMVMDFHELEKLLHAVVSCLHNRHLNELDEFAAINPSAENVALHIARALPLPASVKIRQVEVWETDQTCAVYRT